MRNKKSSLPPWVAIWVQPRAVVKSALKRNRRDPVHLLAMLYGIETMLFVAFNANMGDKFQLSAILVFSLLVGPLAGLFSLYYWGAFLTWAGRWIGGKGDHLGVRVAYAWSYLPEIWTLVVWVPAIGLIGRGLFKKEMGEVSAGITVAYGLFCLVCLVAIFWEIVVSAKCIGEAHKFSAWKGYLARLLAVVISLAAWAVPTLVLYGFVKMDWGKWF